MFLFFLEEEYSAGLKVAMGIKTKDTREDLDLAMAALLSQKPREGREAGTETWTLPWKESRWEVDTTHQLSSPPTTENQAPDFPVSKPTQPYLSKHDPVPFPTLQSQ